MASRTAPATTRRPQTAVDSDDAVMLRAAELAAWAQKNARVIIAAAVVVLLTVGGFLYYRLYQASRAERAAAQFLQVGQAAATGEGAQARGELESFIRRYDGTREADEARVMLAGIHLKENQPRRAIAPLREVTGGDSPLSFPARMLLGAALHRDGKRDEAIQTYLDAAGDADLQYQRNEALNAAALLREQAGDWRGAAELYQRMLRDAEKGSMDESILQMRLTEAQSHGVAGAPAPGGK
jgi:predicted negative regulator of RcsB-dependent stress response